MARRTPHAHPLASTTPRGRAAHDHEGTRGEGEGGSRKGRAAAVPVAPCAELRCVTRAAAGETARTRVRSEWEKIVFTTDQSRTQNVGTHSSVRAHAH